MAAAGIDDAGSHPRAALILGMAMAAAALILIACQQLFARLPGTGPAAALGAPVQEALFTFLLFGLLLVTALIGLRVDGRRPAAGPAPFVAGTIGLGIGLGGLFAAAGLAAVAAGLGGGTGEGQGGVAILLGTVAVLLQAGTEEVYFRGWLQPILVRRWGRVGGVAVAAAAFAALHVVGGARSPLTLLNLFLGGVLFGVLALRSGGLAAPIAAHAGWNWAEQILLGLDPNPGSGSFGAIADFDLTGGTMWGGSAEGLNASIAMTFVLVALILPAAAWRWRLSGPDRRD